ncbi:hypothetical protein [Streptomyces tirandamycinicus]|uniref:Uncharacterized protein n=1 Tax=Streptomyces tirandamycinicus TaxID=2174846 RepID=A0A2S1T264_9ACTN|nr:hypothetical protein [Streptomyces tirandamycinicus]AWI32728.1 hypothetical protein DDW44_30920 [Streptomyces tirandamycinicus]
MTFDAPEPLFVWARVRAGELEAVSMIPVLGVSWGRMRPVSLRHAVRRAKVRLFNDGALCESCAGAYGDVPGPCADARRRCSPVRLTIWTGTCEYPLTDDLLTVYPSVSRLRLFARTLGNRTLFSTVEVGAAEWTGSTPEQRHAIMRDVVERLKRSALGEDTAGIRTFIMDGEREIPYPANWTGASADHRRYASPITA